jgi:glycosyltransferase involved in cell wall biosynthesis
MIWIDVTDLQSWNGHMTGIQRVVFNIADCYKKNNSNVNFFYYDHTSGEFYATVLDFDTWITDRTDSNDNSNTNAREMIRKIVPAKVVHHTPSIVKNAAKKSIKKLRSSKTRMIRAAKSKTSGNNVPLIFDNSDQLIVLGNAWNNRYMFRDLGIKKYTEDFKLINVVYDLIPVLQPQFFGNLLTTQYTEYLFEAIDNSDLLLPISKSTDHDLTRFCLIVGLSKPITKVIRLGDELGLSRPMKSTWYKERPYILSVGTMEVRKNHTLLYYAYKYMIEKVPNDDIPDLIICGSSGWYTSDVAMLFKKDPLVSKYVRILHNTSDQELEWLYENALMTVYPSMYEGWGLPVAESLAYGKVTLSSNSSSMPEVGGNLVDYFSPYDPIECANLIQKYTNLEVRVKREKLIKSNYKITSWEATYNQIKSSIN